MGKTVNGLGIPIDETRLQARHIRRQLPDPMSRAIIDRYYPGVKAVDGMITVGKGQRIVSSPVLCRKVYVDGYVCQKYQGRY
ncbi:hypothetical protein [Waltera sp.]|uniref:hypothetical protein n=1 Tax=Waltera sp. TaxID=2815806 RepID=UPI003990786F